MMHRIAVNRIARGRRRTDAVRYLHGVTIAIIQVLLAVLAQAGAHVHVITHVIAADAVLVAAPQAVAHHDAGRSVEAILQVVAHHPEIRQPHPARLHRARA